MPLNFGDSFHEIIKERKLEKDYFAEIISCPYELTTTYTKGTVRGPEAIIEASQELEFYDDELDLDTSEFGIKTLSPIVIEELQDANTPEPFKALYDVCADAYKRDKFPVVMGGEHSLSLGPVKAAYDKCKAEGKKLTLLHFDAHADLRDEYLGNPYNHACAIRSIYDACPGIKILSVGIRNISRSEVTWLKGLEKNSEELDRKCPIKIFYARNEITKSYPFAQYLSNYISGHKLPELKHKINKSSFSNRLSFEHDAGYWSAADAIKAMKDYGNDNFYITFDVDGFDSSVIPCTGTPEPGGLDWYTPINIITEACKQFNLVGADVVELSPKPEQHASDFLTAKLIYKIINLKKKFN